MCIGGVRDRERVCGGLKGEDGISWLYLFDVGVFSKDNQEGTLSGSLVLLPNLVPKSSSRPTLPTVFRKPWLLAPIAKQKMTTGTSTGVRRSSSMTPLIKSGFTLTKESTTSGTSTKFVARISSLRMSNATKKRSNVKVKPRRLLATIIYLSPTTFLASTPFSPRSSRRIKTKSASG